MMTSTHLGAVAAATSIPSTTATGATAAPTGTNALFGVVQTTLTIGSVIPLLLALVAMTFHHMHLGLQVIYEDYINAKWLMNMVILGTKAISLLLGLMAAVAVLKLALS